MPPNRRILPTITVAAALGAVGAWRVATIDKVTARTILLLWHELYYVRKEAHDFANMLAPQNFEPQHNFHVGAMRHEELLAIAHCVRDKNGDTRVGSVAHAPDRPEAAAALLQQITSGPDWERSRAQPRWFLEKLFVAEGLETSECILPPEDPDPDATDATESR